MIKIIQQRKRIETVEYNLEFHWADEPGAGFSFPCDNENI